MHSHALESTRAAIRRPSSRLIGKLSLGGSLFDSASLARRAYMREVAIRAHEHLSEISEQPVIGAGRQVNARDGAGIRRDCFVRRELQPDPAANGTQKSWVKPKIFWRCQIGATAKIA